MKYLSTAPSCGTVCYVEHGGYNLRMQNRIPNYEQYSRVMLFVMLPVRE